MAKIRDVDQSEIPSEQDHETGEEASEQGSEHASLAPLSTELIATSKEELAQQVAQRYGLERSGYYGRRKALGIDPVELPGGEGWMFDENQVRLFDLLDQWVKAGKPAKLFQPPAELVATVIENGELLEQERSRLRRAQELKAATMIATYRQAATLTPDDLPPDLREAVQEERVKFMAGHEPTHSLENMVQAVLSGKL